MHTGSCLCGGVRFRILSALAPIQICHCGQCRKAQGAPLATNIPVSLAQLHFESGEALLRSFESSPGKQRLFCSVCGSPVLSRRDSRPGEVRIRAGLLDEPVAAGLAFHAYVDSACGWWPLPEDGLPRHSGAKSAP